MIPARIRQIVKATALAAAIVLLWFLAYDRMAGVAFVVTTLWMIANLVVWSIVMRIVLRSGENKGGAGILMAAVTAKLVLLFGGVIALKVFAPYTRIQIFGIIAGVSSVLVVAFLKALGSRISLWAKAPDRAKKDTSAKVF